MKWRSLEEPQPHTETRTLREIYAERKALIENYVPVEVRETHLRVVQELKQSIIEDRVLQPGSKAPEFELHDQHGKIVRSADLLERGLLVICFIRGRWCPFCVGQMQAMNAIMPELQRLNASVIAISPQTVHQSFLMCDQHQLGFPLLSDSGNGVARKFGLVYRVPEYQQQVYSRAFVNIPFVNGDKSWELAIPATFVLGSNHTIVRGSANADYMERPEPRDILRWLVDLRS